MSKFCPVCGASVADSAEACPDCGEAIVGTERVRGRVGILSRTIAGALAYFTIIPPLVFLLVEPYKKDRFVRFHSLQCLAFWLLLLIIAAALWIIGSVLGIIPVLPMLLLSTLIVLAAVVIWIVLIVKALSGESFKLPWVGDLAEQQTSAN
jgi:uncharacterized membrane protein